MQSLPHIKNIIKVADATFSRRTIAFGFLLLLSFNTLYLARHTPTNWDMLAYSWLALEDSKFTSEAKFAEVYKLARNKLADKEYDQLVGKLPFGDEKYRQIVSQDHKLFEDQLGFYRVKPTLPLMMKGLGIFGLDPLRAGKYIVLFSYFSFGFLFFLILRTKAPDLVAAGASYFALSSSFTTSVGWQITPDALSCLVLTGAFYLYQVRGKGGAAILLLLLSVFVRPDNAILCGVFLLSFILLNIGPRKWLALAMVILTAEYLALVSSVSYLGWSTHFYVTFVERIADIKGFQSDLQIADYLRRYPAILVAGVQNGHFLAFALIAQLLISDAMSGGRFGAILRNFFVLLLALLGAVFLFSASAPVLGVDVSSAVQMRLWFPLVLGTFIASVLLMAYLYFLPSKFKQFSKNDMITILPPTAIYMLVHFLLFPIDKDRMLLGAYLVTIYFLMEAVLRRFVALNIVNEANIHNADQIGRS